MSLTPPSVNPSTPTPTPEAAASDDSSPVPSTPVTTTSSHSGSHFGITSNGIRLTVCSLSGYTWPAELILDLGKSNWIEWSDELHLLTLQQGLDPWLDGSLACPDPSSSADANYIWHRNDGALRAFILGHISTADKHIARPMTTTHLMYEKLKSHHEQQGAFAQINLLLKALQIEFTYDTPIRDTVATLRTFYQRIDAMGKLQGEDIFSVLLLNAMNKHFGPIQQSINTLSSMSSITAEMIAKRMLDEDTLVLRRVEKGQPANPYTLSPSISSSSAFAALSSRPRSPRPPCSNCKREGHSVDYCIAPGGKMAGRSLEDARAARASARPSRPTHNQSAHVASTAPSNTSTPGTVFVNGLPYVPDPTWKSTVPSSAHITEVSSSPDTNDYQFHQANFAFYDLPSSPPPPSPLAPFSSAFSVLSTPSSFVACSTAPASSSNLPFIIDTGASCHISPFLSDFQSLRPITPHPIKGLGGMSVDAIGIGTIVINTSSGRLTLNNAFFVPKSTVRLVLVFLLGDSKCSGHFYPSDGYCFITDANNSIVAHGVVLPDRKLFILSDVSVLASPSSSSPSVAHFASRLPGINAWHKRLGHCGHRTVIDMARSRVVQGMPIDLASPPPACEHCILGKQTRSSVLKNREGFKAEKPLDRVYVDLCGPMSVPSRSGFLYCMNIIDDYSGFVWSIPLRFKHEAAAALKAWHLALTVQTPYCLKSFVTDNGELCSTNIHQWCKEKGVLHLFTAPYTSAQNGHAERLHRTLMDKARSMRSACGAPFNMWDEFCATAAYLTNFTGASANKGKTPYQLWYNHEPSLSHLREIGCRAFALIPTHNPKIHPRSIPCTLIGYAPQSKAYRLWDRLSDRIFNSFHVSFIESHNSPPPPTSLPSSSIHLQRPSNIQHNSDQPLPRRPPPLLQQPNAMSLSPFVHFFPSPSSVPAVSPHNHQQQPPSNPTSSSCQELHHQQHPNTPTIPSSSSSSVPSNSVNTNDSSPTFPNLNVTDNIISSVTLPTTSNSGSVHLLTHTNNTVSNNTNNTVTDNTSNRNTVLHQVTNNPVLRQVNTDPVPHQDTTTPDSNTPQESHPPISVTPPSPLLTPDTNLPPPPPLRRSPRLAAIRSLSSPDHSFFSSHADDQLSAFISEFAPVRDTHCLVPLSLAFPHSSYSVSDALSAISTGDTDTLLDSDDDPLWASAMSSPEREYWIAGAREEIQSLEDLNVFVLVPRSELPPGQRPLKGKLVCKRKRDDAGNISRYKVRYVAKGFAQRYLVDYEKTTAPTARLESFRVLLHIAAVLDWDIQHVDIKTAFLHGVLPENETVFMEQPPGFESPGKEDWVMRLLKSLYGMKQASRIWNQTFHKTITALGFVRLTNEWCVYRRETPSNTTIFAVHVDDIITISSTPAGNETFKQELRRHWDISDLGEVKYALGIAISRDRSARTISLSQTALIDRVVDQFCSPEAHPVDTLMVPGLQIVRPDKSLPVSETILAWMKRTPYRSLVGSLNYLAVATRPDISFAVGRLATVLDCYRPEHWDAATRVVRYLKGTRQFSLDLSGTNPIRPIGFSDSDYANCPTTSRSIGGYCFTLGSGMVSWASRKQPVTADSSCYAEYISLHEASHEVLFLRQLLDGLHLSLSDATPLHCDNDAARQLTEDQRWHARVRHFHVKYHTTRELVELGELQIVRVRSSDNSADILTKSLARPDFLRLQAYLGVRPPRIS